MHKEGDSNRKYETFRTEGLSEYICIKMFGNQLKWHLGVILEF